MQRLPNQQQTPPNRPMNKIRPKRPGLGGGTVLLCALIITSCTVGPDYHGPPKAAVPAQWKAQPPWKEGHPQDAEIKQNFWDVFEDPVLTGLELEATTNSPDVRAAFEADGSGLGRRAHHPGGSVPCPDV